MLAYRNIIPLFVDELSNHGIDTWYLKPEDSKDPQKVKQKGQILLRCKVIVRVINIDAHIVQL